MAEIKRDMFPPNIMQRIQTPVNKRIAISDISISKERPWGNMLYPRSQQAVR